MKKNTQSCIKFIGHYFQPNLDNSARIYSPAATTKIDYICSLLLRKNYEIEIISPCKTITPKYVPTKKLEISAKKKLVLLMSLGRGGKIRNALDFFLGNITLLLYLILRTKKNEIIIVYHSLGFSGIINIAKKIRGFKVILETEEIYQHVVNCSAWQKYLENYSLNVADGYIFPTILLDRILNKENKPKLIIHGSYTIHDHHGSYFSDKYINIVYAGTFQDEKGVYSSINSAKFLPKNYRIHILGFGTEQEIRKVIDTIKKTNAISNAKVFYHGLVTGISYSNFLSGCSIGLCTQSSSANFNPTSFPSKILSYLSHGLQVVAIRMESLETSDIGKLLHYYENDDPKLIAESILSINLQSAQQPKEFISALDAKILGAVPQFMSSLASPSH